MSDLAWARMLTVFVYPNTVDDDMGALDVWPGTHTHFHFLSQDDKWTAYTAPALRIAVPAGSVVVMDSRLHHRGSANTSKKRRPTLYFSFVQRRGERPDGATYSLRRQYEGKRQVVLQDVIDKARPYFDKANQGGGDGGDSHDSDRGCVGHCGLSGESGGKYFLQGPGDGAGGETVRETVEEEDVAAASDSGRPMEPITFFMPGGNQHVQYDLSPHAITETCRRMTLDDEDCGRFHEAAREQQRLGGVA